MMHFTLLHVSILGVVFIVDVVFIVEAVFIFWVVLILGGGWVVEKKTKLMLYSSLVEIEVGVELGNDSSP